MSTYHLSSKSSGMYLGEYTGRDEWQAYLDMMGENGYAPTLNGTVIDEQGREVSELPDDIKAIKAFKTEEEFIEAMGNDTSNLIQLINEHSYESFC